ncbi:MAG TPA: efflux RND transporter periplasmic adaptor subunit [Kofleriaceae bacterium]|nr:efflux RND transporter periplasmic adaptor subunit [Kofleriaceae bacterium]
MRRPLIFMIGVAAIAALALGGYALYRLGMSHGMDMAATAPSDSGARPRESASLKAGDIDPATGKRVLYWHDPMVPGRRFDQPGKSPFMNMQLVPVYEGGNGADGGVTVSARVQQNLGMRTAEVVRTTMAPRIEAVGNIAFNERDQAVVQARAMAYVEKLHVRATLDRVAAGAPLADLYVPEWVAAQEEFLSVLRMRGTELAVLVDGARQRMRQVGMSDEQIRRVEELGQVQPRIALRAPLAGVIVELEAREGMTVMPGDTLFRINGLSTVWANAAVPESQAALLRPGAPVEARSAAIPDTVFAGTVQAILPDVDPDTRTIKARVELANPDFELAPGMFVSVALAGPATDTLIVPTEAVIETGRRTVVMLAESNGTFQPVDVEIGIESNGQTEIKRGLSVGQMVVVSGQFLIDSEASLRATSTRMEDRPPMNEPTTEHFGEGKVESLDDESVTLSHAPIPSVPWPAMTMRFALPPGGPLHGVEVGDDVRFAFAMGGDGNPRITRIEPIAESPQ